MARVIDLRARTTGQTVNGSTSPASTLFTDIILGGRADDTLSGLNGRDQIYGFDGDDRLFGGAGFDRIFGGNGNDFIRDLDRGGRLHGDNGNDTIEGGDGAFAYGGSGNDLITVGDGARVWGDLFNNRSSGQADDILAGARSIVNAGAGNDYVVAGLGSTVRGDTGNDTLEADATRGASTRTTTLDGGVGDDLFFVDADSSGTVLLRDSSGDDIMVLADFDSTAIDARRDGSNLIISLFDPDDETSVLTPAVYATIQVTGQYSGANTIENLAFTEPNALGNGDGVDPDRLIGYELRRSLDARLDADNQMLVGTAQGDTVFGGAGDDILFGAAGADRLVGDDEIEGSDDILVGGRGLDTLLGGDGQDLFRFSFADLGTGVDIIEDFDINNDILDLTELLRFNESINPQTPGFLRAVQDGDDALVQVDVDGSANVDGGANRNFVSVVRLLGVDRRDLDLFVDFDDPTANVLF